MPTRCYKTYGQVRQCPWKVVDACWSPTNQLVALLTDKGDLVLQRLSWKKAWRVKSSSLPSDIPTTSGGSSASRIRCLCWNPEGRMVVGGSSTGALHYFDFESGAVVFSHQAFVEQVPVVKLVWSKVPDGKQPQHRRCVTPLPFGQLPSVEEESAMEPNWPDLLSSSVDYTDSRTLLMALSEDGRLTLLVDGILPLALIDLATRHPEQPRPSVSTSDFVVDFDRQRLSLVLSSDRTTSCAIWDVVSLLSSCSDAVAVTNAGGSAWMCARKYARVVRCQLYVDVVLAKMKECWEDALLSLDNKFQAYAKEKFLVDGLSVADDLIVLLAFGTASSELETFLLHSLTDKGVKKIFQFLDRSYERLSELVQRNLYAVTVELVHCVSELSREYDSNSAHTDVYKAWRNALQEAGSLLLKVGELNRVISTSGTQLRSFFRWLHVALLRLAGESTQTIDSISSDDDNSGTENFIKDTFSKVWQEDCANGLFRLEIVGQYLENNNLWRPMDRSKNLWTETERCLRETETGGHGLLYRENVDASLVQCVGNLKNAVDKAIQVGVYCNAVGVRLMVSDDVPTSSTKVRVVPPSQKNPWMQFVTLSTVDTGASRISFAVVLESGEVKECILGFPTGIQPMDFDVYGSEELMVALYDAKERKDLLMRIPLSMLFGDGAALDHKFVTQSDTEQVDRCMPLESGDVSNRVSLLAVDANCKFGLVVVDGTRAKLVDLAATSDDDDSFNVTVEMS